MKNIKDRDVLIICAGDSINKYQNEINRFIKENKVITLGCNYINDFFTPDIHFWGDGRRYLEYGKHISKKSDLVFGQYVSSKTIRKYWKGSYKIIKYTQKKWKKSYEDPKSKKYGMGKAKYDYKRKIYHGVFRTMGSLIIFWAHTKKASRISIVGMDGYTFYSEGNLKNKTDSQHCYGRGFTDVIANAHGTKKSEKFYKFCLEKDQDVNKTLKALKKYGIKFDIITPTVYKNFHNDKIL